MRHGDGDGKPIATAGERAGLNHAVQQPGAFGQTRETVSADSVGRCYGLPDSGALGRWSAVGGAVMTLAAGAFLMPVCVQGAWGVVPVHLNALSPPPLLGTFAGLCAFAEVMDRFFALYANANGFVQLVLVSSSSGAELLRCAPRRGDQPLI